jgi:predicted GNAT family acetyltransferase
MSQITVRDVPDAHRFEAVRDGVVVGHIAYRRTSRGYALLHTEVEPEAEGGGVGSALARGTLDTLRQQGQELLPYCPFVQGWIARHPEYAALVPQDQRAKFDLD